MKKEIKEVAKLLEEWQKRTRKSKGLSDNMVCDLELTKEENKELAILAVKLKGGVMNDGSDDFWETHFEQTNTDEDFFSFFEYGGTIWLSWDALGDGPIDDEPEEWTRRALEIIKSKVTE